MNIVDLTKLKDGEIVHFKGGGSEIVPHVEPTYTKAEITHEQFKHHVTFGSTAEFLRKTDEDQESVSFNEWLSWIVATTIVIWLVIVVML
jgi:hypothetical protein